MNPAVFEICMDIFDNLPIGDKRLLIDLADEQGQKLEEVILEIFADIIIDLDFEDE